MPLGSIIAVAIGALIAIAIGIFYSFKNKNK
jgi:LPXTG-motif cell wall-anchored protein